MKIENFKGKSVVIGCISKSSCASGLHPRTDFFTIDLDPGADHSMDIRTPDLPTSLKERFHLVMTENLDITTYNEIFISKATKGRNQGFDNILAMTHPDGFILIIGSDRLKEYRQCVCSRQLNYIELDNQGACLLIAKNQLLGLEDIKKIIQKPPFAELIKKAIKYQRSTVIPADKLTFCDIKDFPTMHEFIRPYLSKPLSYNDRLIKCINDFVARKKNAPETAHQSLDQFQTEGNQLVNRAKENGENCNQDALIQLANKTFEHRHYLRRAFLDMLLCMTIVFPLVRKAQGKSCLFFLDQKTQRQKDFEEELHSFPHSLY